MNDEKKIKLIKKTYDNTDSLRNNDEFMEKLCTLLKVYLKEDDKVEWWKLPLGTKIKIKDFDNGLIVISGQGIEKEFTKEHKALFCTDINTIGIGYFFRLMDNPKSYDIIGD